MGFYSERVLPRLVDRACRSSSLGRWRAGVTEGLTGRVVEVGFGSGLNADYYPAEVELVLAVEPAAVARKLAVILHRMWQTGNGWQAYPQSRNNTASNNVCMA